MTPGPIDGAITALDHSLRGPRRARADLLGEVRDGLTDATAPYQEAGLSRAEAERRALADFGDLDEVADDLQAELTARHGWRSALLITIGFPVLVVLWDVVWLTDTVPPKELTPTVAFLSDAIDGVAGVAALIGIAAAIGLCLSARRGWPVNRFTKGIGLLGYCTVAVIGTLSTLMQTNDLHRAGRVMDVPLVLAVTAVSVLAAVWVLAWSSRCLGVARATRA
ncbi:MAG: hypothetical protein GEU98_21620 [Pseudonocardiaceae bacterium]|nr:hypothetical protein [Pseudonocardiaceae bacterium]